jgi:hypothetical protein
MKRLMFIAVAAIAVTMVSVTTASATNSSSVELSAQGIVPGTVTTLDLQILGGGGVIKWEGTYDELIVDTATGGGDVACLMQIHESDNIQLKDGTPHAISASVSAEWICEGQYSYEADGSTITVDLHFFDAQGSMTVRTLANRNPATGIGKKIRTILSGSGDLTGIHGTAKGNVGGSEVLKYHIDPS